MSQSRFVAGLVLAGSAIVASCSVPEKPRPIAQQPIDVDVATGDGAISPPPFASAAPDASNAPPPDDAGLVDDPPSGPTCDRTLRCAPMAPSAITSISLSRAPCYGHCPVYQVTIKRDGSVAWQGNAYVDATGARTGTASGAATNALFDLVAKSCFFSMKDEYRFGPTDHSWAHVTVAASTTKKTVHHYAPDEQMCEVPAALAEIEKRIDEVAKTSTWIGRGGANANPGAPKPNGQGSCTPPFTIDPKSGVKKYKEWCI